jgi:hypothetical protein
LPKEGAAKQGHITNLLTNEDIVKRFSRSRAGVGGTARALDAVELDAVLERIAAFG